MLDGIIFFILMGYLGYNLTSLFLSMEKYTKFRYLKYAIKKTGNDYSIYRKLPFTLFYIKIIGLDNRHDDLKSAAKTMEKYMERDKNKEHTKWIKPEDLSGELL